MTETTRTFPNLPVMIRLATAVDGPALELLAELDSARAPVGAALIAERNGQAVAALALDDGVLIANPFERSGDLVALLRLRAGQVAVRQTAGRGARLARWATASGKPIRHASDRLHRFLERADVTVQ